MQFFKVLLPKNLKDYRLYSKWKLLAYYVVYMISGFLCKIIRVLCGSQQGTMISEEKKTQWGQKYFFQNGIVCKYKYVYDIILNVFFPHIRSWTCFTVIVKSYLNLWNPSDNIFWRLNTNYLLHNCKWISGKFIYKSFLAYRIVFPKRIRPVI